MTPADYFQLAEEIDTRLDDYGCDRGVAKALRSRVWALGRERDAARADVERLMGILRESIKSNKMPPADETECRAALGEAVGDAWMSGRQVLAGIRRVASERDEARALLRAVLRNTNAGSAMGDDLAARIRAALGEVDGG